ncbi:MAG: sigma-E processing peptidase SpoIIGA [Bacillaceae bacterium]|nr:sigma-E processing peptidase SpoIIGA [Bacillaceae bacterium]
MVVYLDVAFLLNFIIDLILLRLTAFFARRTVSSRRLILGALVGAGYTVFLFFPPLSFLYTFAIKLLFSMVIICIVFGFHRWTAFLWNLTLFYFVSFLIGGGILALHFFLQGKMEMLSGVALVQTQGVFHPVTFSLLAVGIPLIVWLAVRTYHGIGRSKRMARYKARVLIEMNQQNVTCEGLVDTGNKLYEPLTRVPVMIIEMEQVKDLLPSSFVDKVREGVNVMEDHDFFTGLDADWANTFRVIPFRGVMGKMDFLLAFRPDGVWIHMEDHVYSPEKVLVGINPEKLASHGDYQAIIHPDLVHEQHLVSDHQSIQQMGEV